MSETISDSIIMRRLGIVILTLCGVSAVLLVIVGLVSHAV